MAGRIAQRDTWVGNFTYRYILQQSTLKNLEENEFYNDMIFCDGKNVERCWFEYARDTFRPEF